MSEEYPDLSQTLAEIAKDPKSHGQPADPDELPPGIGIAPEFYCIMGGCDNLPKLRIRPKIGDEYEIRAYACDDHFGLLHGGSEDQWVTSEDRDEVFPEVESSEPVDGDISPEALMRKIQDLVESRVNEDTPLDQVQPILDRLADSFNLSMAVAGLEMPFKIKFTHTGDHNIIIDTEPN